jgi:hypothetical protein
MREDIGLAIQGCTLDLTQPRAGQHEGHERPLVERQRSTGVFALANARGGIGKANVCASAASGRTKPLKNRLPTGVNVVLGNLDIMLAFDTPYIWERVFLEYKRLREIIVATCPGPRVKRAMRSHRSPWRSVHRHG